MACGGDDDGGAPASPAARALTAESLVPDLGTLGYRLDQQERDAASVGGADVWRVLWQKTGTANGALAKIYVFPGTDLATQQFEALSAALRNPPPDFLGGAKATWVDTKSPAVGEQQKAYQTRDTDPQGNRAWTDVYRFGRVVVIVQLLDTGLDQLPQRTALAKSFAEKAK